MIIEINDATITTIIKGDHSSKPLGFVSWGGHIAPKSGIKIAIGHRGETGLFISKEILLQLLEEIAFKEKELENGDDSDNS
jgi:hypothetical protein